MSIGTRRTVIRVVLLIDVLCVVALLVAVLTGADGNRNGAVTAGVFLVASLVAGLLYLRSTRGRS